MGRGYKGYDAPSPHAIWNRRIAVWPKKRKQEPGEETTWLIAGPAGKRLHVNAQIESQQTRGSTTQQTTQRKRTQQDDVRRKRCQQDTTELGNRGNRSQSSNRTLCRTAKTTEREDEAKRYADHSICKNKNRPDEERKENQREWSIGHRWGNAASYLCSRACAGLPSEIYK